jgi:hypothetical protein
MLLLFRRMTNGLRSELGGGGAPAFIGGGAPTDPAPSDLAVGRRYRQMNRRLDLPPVHAAVGRIWRLLQPPNHLAAGSRALRLRHYRRFKRRLQGLPPFEAVVGSCRQFNRRFEATFDKV